MAIRHIGFGVHDKDGDLLMTEEGDLALYGEKNNIEKYIEHLNENGAYCAPYKIVRVLIDDGEGE